MATLKFDGRVVAITGAGRGLGREHALLFASRGGAVVVNDYGLAMDGVTREDSPAEAVVAEIKAAGGKAVANLQDITKPEGGASVIEDAIKHFGRIDAVVNNAGVVGHSTFEDCSIEERDANMAVHYWGHWNVTKAAWGHMKKQRYGRVVNIFSGAATAGAPARVAYSSAKGAIIGFTRTLAIEGKEHGIKVNALGPAAYTRMTAYSFKTFGKGLSDGTPEGQEKWMSRFFDPRHPAAGVFVLAHESCSVTGNLYQCSGGRMARFVLGEAEGFVSGDIANFGPEMIMQNWERVDSLEPYAVLDGPTASMAHHMELSLKAEKEASKA